MSMLYQVIKRPVCLEQILQRVDDHVYAAPPLAYCASLRLMCRSYNSLSQFMDDIYLLVSNAKEYNPPSNDPQRVSSKVDSSFGSN